jgi:hypothetical protein
MDGQAQMQSISVCSFIAPTGSLPLTARGRLLERTAPDAGGVNTATASKQMHCPTHRRRASSATFATIRDFLRFVDVLAPNSNWTAAAFAKD